MGSLPPFLFPQPFWLRAWWPPLDCSKRIPRSGVLPRGSLRLCSDTFAGLAFTFLLVRSEAWSQSGQCKAARTTELIPCFFVSVLLLAELSCASPVPPDLMATSGRAVADEMVVVPGPLTQVRNAVVGVAFPPSALRFFAGCRLLGMLSRTLRSDLSFFNVSSTALISPFFPNRAAQHASPPPDTDTLPPARSC